MKFFQQKKGIILLYSLLIISLVTAIAVTVSIIIINEIKLTTSATDGTLAYYAAESGLERGLYTLKAYRMDSAKTMDDALAAIRLLIGNDFVNNANYDDGQSGSNAPAIENQLIKKDQYLQADYYNVTDPLQTSGVQSIWLHNAGTTDSGWAEVSWTAWSNTGELGSATNARKVIGPTDLLSGWTINLDVFSPTVWPVGYRVRVRALFDDISSLTMRPYNTQNGSPPPPDGNGIGTQVTQDLPSDIVIQSIGNRGQFKQALTASLPWKLPLFGLYDYVLFSEGDILKTTIINKPIYSSGAIQVEANNTTIGTCANCAACQASGWSATACTATASCTIQAATNPSYCSLAAVINNFFTLPIPVTIPAGDEYYISVRTMASSSGNMEARVSDPDQGETGLTFNYPASGASWSSCTIPESIALGSSASRSVQFTNKSAVLANLDWYQISTYKIFPDCN